MNKFKIINEPYYMWEACDCCEGWWYDKYFIKLNEEWVEVVSKDTAGDCDYFGEWDKRVSFGTVEEAEEYIKDTLLRFDIEVIDGGYPEMDSYDEEVWTKGKE